MAVIPLLNHWEFLVYMWFDGGTTVVEHAAWPLARSILTEKLPPVGMSGHKLNKY